MKILMVGSGGREHALIRKLKESPKVDKIYCTPGNGGISIDAECFDVAATDINGVVELAKKLAVDFVFVAPDDPLVAGMVDALEKENIRAFGPRKNAAIIEGSKAFAKDLMRKYKIPTANYKIFEKPSSALDYIRSKNRYPTVIKADGLALGKGVIIAENLNEAEDAIKEIMSDKVFGASGNRVVIEEYVTGPEVSVLAFTDGKCIKPMVSAMDHKRVFAGDLGPNTGGMGTISPNPFYDEKTAERCMNEIFVPTMNAMNKEGRTFKGCLFFGLMITKNGPKVIEYNARFGDPEAQVVLPRLRTDLVDIIEAIQNETLSQLNISWDDGACACVVMASGGYPGKYEKGIRIYGLDENGQLKDAAVYHAGTSYRNGKFYTNGGRVIGITAKGSTVDEALKNAYDGVAKVNFEKAHFRKDIGQRKIF